MEEQGQPVALLNVFEVEHQGTVRHLVCFLDPALARVRGIESRAVVGEYTPGPGNGFNTETFALNPEFIEAFSGYMNELGSLAPDIVAEAARRPDGRIFILDPRFTGGDGDEPPPTDLLGCYSVDGAGRIVPGSFQYNPGHSLFDPGSGLSAVLYDRRFYEWLHPGHVGGAGIAASA